MQARATFLGHPIHQMIIVVPLGLLATTATFDVIGAARRNRQMLRSSKYMLEAGLIGAAASAIPGAMDYWSIPSGTRAKRIGLLHGVGNLVVTALFLTSWIKRRRNPARLSRAALVCSTTAAMTALVTGWLGGELVDRLGIGVHDDANVQAPNSLSNMTVRKAS